MAFVARWGLLLLAAVVTVPIKVGATVANSTNTNGVTRYSLRSEVSSRFANTTVSLDLNNTKNCTDVVQFKLQLPTGAKLNVVKLTTPDGCDMQSHIQTQYKANQTFLHALQQGHIAALIQAFDVHSLDVTVSVPTVSTARLSMRYGEVLLQKGGKIDVVLPLAPGVAVDVIQATFDVSEPETGITGLDCGPTLQQHAQDLTVHKQFSGSASSPAANGQVVVSVKAGAARQEGGFAERLACNYQPGPLPENGLLMLDTDAHLLFLFNPPSLQTRFVPKMIWLVVDVSGSMSGQKLRDAKDSLVTIIGTLHDLDHFGVATFESQMPQSTWGPVPATAANKKAAQVFVIGMSAGGGTNLHDACVTGVQYVSQHRTGNQVPIMVLLTDGVATSGETRRNVIRANVLKANEYNVKIYALAFGAGADYDLLVGLTLDNQGQTVRIYEGYGDSAQQITTFLRNSVGNVLLSDLAIGFTGAAVVEQTCTAFPLLAAGSEVAVRARLGQRSGTLTVKTDALCATGVCNFTLSSDLNAKQSSLPRQVGAQSLAHVRISELMANHTAQSAIQLMGQAAAAKKMAADLAVGAGILWPGLTSIVITKSDSCGGLSNANATQAVCVNSMGNTARAGPPSPSGMSLGYSYSTGTSSAPLEAHLKMAACLILLVWQGM